LSRSGFDNPARLATGAGLIGAGIAFALQKVVTSFAGYFVILRGNTFSVGDRIKMGSVRGDVIALNFIQTVIMEMGEPPSVQEEDPGMWVRSRQYSGRIVTISNAQIFEEPVYNYSRDFPYIWEEMHLPISFKHDRNRAEQNCCDGLLPGAGDSVSQCGDCRSRTAIRSDSNATPSWRERACPETAEGD
jgi:small-conductance mechanosensitive channel